MRLENKSARDLVDVVLELDGSPVGREHQIHPEKVRRFLLPIESLNVPDLPTLPETRAGQLLNEKLAGRLEVAYELDGYRFRRSGTGEVREA